VFVIPAGKNPRGFLFGKSLGGHRALSTNKQKPNSRPSGGAMATKTRKTEIVAELEALFQKSQVAIIADLSGYTVAEITQFRRKLSKDNAQCKIAKNTLIELASAKGQFESVKELTKGPTALILGYDDPAAPAKTTVQFIKQLKKGIVRGGVLENKLLSARDVGDLADLPSKDVLLSGIAGGLDSGARGVVTILNNIICDIALLVEEVAKKTEGASSAVELTHTPDQGAGQDASAPSM